MSLCSLANGPLGLTRNEENPLSLVGIVNVLLLEHIREYICTLVSSFAFVLRTAQNPAPGEAPTENCLIWDIPTSSVTTTELLFWASELPEYRVACATFCTCLQRHWQHVRGLFCAICHGFIRERTSSSHLSDILFQGDSDLACLLKTKNGCSFLKLRAVW